MSMAAQRVRDYLVPYMGERVVVAVRPDDVRGYRLWLQGRELKPRTVRHVLTDVRCMFAWAVESGELTRSPFPRRIMPRIQEEAPDRLTDDQVEMVLGIPEPYAFVIRLALGTGLRWGELVRAQAAHLEGGMLVVAHTKSSRLRRVPLTAALAGEVGARVGRLVPYAECSANSFNRSIRLRSRLKTFHVHQLRHTFACRWVEGGGSLPSLQQILGHASVVTTQHYARLSDESVRLEAARVMGAIAGR